MDQSNHMSAQRQSSAEEVSYADQTSKIKGKISQFIDNIRSFRELQLLLAIIFIGALLRIYQLGAESIWLDEAATYFLSSDNLSGIYEATKNDVHPPLYYFVVHFFLLTGKSEILLRFPSMVFGIIAIPLLYMLGTRMFTVKEGLISSFLLSVSLSHIYYSQEARMYSMMVFLTLGSIFFFYSAIEDKRNGFWFLFVVFTVLNIYTHYFGFFIFPIEIFYFLILLFSYENRTLHFRSEILPQVKAFFISAVSIVVLIIPRIQVFFEQAASRVGGEVTWGVDQTYFISSLLSHFTFSPSPSLLYLTFFALGAIAMVLSKRRQAVLLCSWFFLPVIVSYYLSDIMPFHPRYLLFILPAYLLIIARGLTATSSFIFSVNTSPKSNRHLSEKKSQVLTVIFVFVLLLSSLGPLVNYYSSPKKDDWRGVASYMTTITRPGDIIAPLPGYISKPFRFYYDNSTDGTFIIDPGSSQQELDSFVDEQTNTIFFILTGDINAANPNGTVISWLGENADVVNIITNVYILTPKK
ncbi:glycosyltransferase family 39 protein [Methanomethylovorans sp.]|uniref:glycosyltransferase family 39 protein n=2 Tax=Methanomethylovorans sp. TaxID=2758717 RepID=UPI001BD62BFC|nr:glycosyltransferase family 39 protein [Methanomethylovorans sp.]